MKRKYTSPIDQEEIEARVAVFIQYMNMGWSLLCSRGKAKLKANDMHLKVYKENESYRLVVDDYLERKNKLRQLWDLRGRL